MLSKPWLAEMNRRRAKHGMARSSTYHAWSAMRQRCLCDTHPHFKDYGGRGIGICARWSDFANFLADKRKTLEQRLRVWPVSRALTEPYIKRKAA